MTAETGLAGEVVTFVGRLLTVSRKRASELVLRLGGAIEPELSVRTTLVVVGADESGVAGAADPDTDPRLRRAAERAQEPGVTLRVVSEDEFCTKAGLVTPSALRQHYYASSTIRARYPAVRDDHLRYLEKWGLLRAVVRTPGEAWYGFADVATIRQAHEELARGAGLKAVLRALAATREGQLALDFQSTTEGQAGRVVRLPARAERLSGGGGPRGSASSPADEEAAEALFVEASRLDTGEADSQPAAMAAYRRALLLAPHLVPALVNLGNLHYAADHFPEAQALYLEAATRDPDCFEAHFNLGNLFHDLGRFCEAEHSYREALRIDPRLCRRAFLPRGHAREATALARRASLLEALPGARAHGRVGGAGQGVHRIGEGRSSGNPLRRGTRRSL
jgi:tetratricopeptide (TPR) repeat protein